MKKRDWIKEKIISIDFDGVLAQYDGFKGDNITGEPISGAKQFINNLLDSGYTPVIFTTRSIELINNWLEKYDFPSIEVTNNKYPSVVYIDDRCIKFDGNYTKLFSDMKNFDVYWRTKNNKIFDDLKK